MLKIILNRLKPRTRKVIAEEQAGFRAGRSTTEQIFRLKKKPWQGLFRLQQDFQDSDIFKKSIKMGLKCILSGFLPFRIHTVT